MLLHVAAFTTQAQTGGSVGIGTTSPDASAALDIVAAGKGLLVPRLDSVARVDITAPATGLLVFQTSPRAGFYYYAGSAAGWRYLPDQTRSSGGDNLGNGVATTTLNLQGNALTGKGAELPAGVVGVGVRADGGLNIGQNIAGNNFCLGYQAGGVSTGVRNTFVGYQSGASNTIGSNNFFVGYRSGVTNTTGDNNHFVGYGSGNSNTTGSGNSFVGSLSGYANTTGTSNLFVGYGSGYANTTASGNSFVGYQAGRYNTTGINNHFEGYLSGYGNTTGANNCFVGYQSGLNLTTGDNNTALGYNAGPTTGNLTNTTAIGANAQASQSNSLVLGGTGSYAVRVGIGTTAPTQPLEVNGQIFSSSGGFRFPDNTVQTTASGKYAQSFTLGGPAYVAIAHNLNSTDVLVSVVETSTGNVLPLTSDSTGFIELKIVDANTIRLGLNLSARAYRVVVLR